MTKSRLIVVRIFVNLIFIPAVFVQSGWGGLSAGEAVFSCPTNSPASSDLPQTQLHLLLRGLQLTLERNTYSQGVRFSLWVRHCHLKHFRFMTPVAGWLLHLGCRWVLGRIRRIRNRNCSWQTLELLFLAKVNFKGLGSAWQDATKKKTFGSSIRPRWLSSGKCW